jgi:hypothetical protein
VTEPSVGPGRDSSEPLEVGRHVRLARSGRRGVIKAIVAPPRAGRSLLVVWDGGIDYSLVSTAEIDTDFVDGGVPQAGLSVHFVDGDSGD